VLTLSTSGEGANSLLLRLHFCYTPVPLTLYINLAIHFNGSNGTAYTRPSKVQNSTVAKLSIDHNKKCIYEYIVIHTLRCMYIFIQEESRRPGVFICASITGSHFVHWGVILQTLKSMTLPVQGQLFIKLTLGYFVYLLA
jgi:hypothetical protein